MSNMRAAIIPKSDQINYEDFLGGKSLTIKVERVVVKLGEQPVTVHYEGENGRPYKPCKTMSRVLVELWGDDETAYIGRSMTLYGDPSVVFGGQAVGGIKISHMSHIRGTATLTLTVSRGKKAVFVIKPLILTDAPVRITRDQQKAIVSAMGDEVKPADLLAHFKVKTSGEILAEQFDAVMKWVNEQKKPVCPECQQSDGHSESCPFAEPPA